MGATPGAAGRGGALFALGVALLAALRAGLVATAFPFFANVDEHKHVDMVWKYARGYLPRPGPEAFEPGMAALLALYGSPEYRLGAGRPLPPPGFALAGAAREARVAANEAFLAGRPNKEAHQPPVYYVLAGAWLGLGRALGLGGGALLYWIRGLGVLAAAGTVLLAAATLRRSHPQSPLVHRGVPLLLAVFPQDALSCVTPDALSPLLGAAVFALAVEIAGARRARALLLAAAGGLAAAAFLAKFTNLALLAPLLLAVGLARREGRTSARGALLLVLALGLPVALWLLRNELVLGDFTGSALKVERLGWGRRPAAELLAHPLFTPGGAVSFASGLLASFWRGELAWHRVTLRWPPADLFYAASSVGCLALAALGLRGRRDGSRAPRAEALALAAFCAGVGLLAVLSLPFAFPEAANPSASRPFFQQGRLISGLLLPFALLYVRGLEWASQRLPERHRARAAAVALAAVCTLALGAELWIARAVLASPYNAFHQLSP